MEGFDDSFYQAHYPIQDPQLGPPSDYPHAQQNSLLPLAYPSSDQFQPETFPYQSHPSDFLSNGAPGALIPSHPNALALHQSGLHSHHPAPSRTPGLGSRIANASMHAYDPMSLPGHGMVMSMEAANSFAYDASTFHTAGALDPNLDRHPTVQRPPLPTQVIDLDPPVPAAYSIPRNQSALATTYWAPPVAQDLSTPVQPAVAAAPSAPAAARPPVETPSTSTARPARDQSGARRAGAAAQAEVQQQSYGQASNTTVAHRFIQPKRPSPKAAVPPRAKTEVGSESPYSSIYSSSGFDILGILAQVVSRPDAKINIGAVDLSCAFVLCDITQDDHPIVYVSEAFERLTGYTNDEIVGHNCRFLQGPDGVVYQGMPRKFVDQNTAFRFRSTIEDRAEIQASIINYRKGGQPFVNLVTMIPIRWGGPDYRFYVGFQVDLVEQPDAVTRRNPNGTYMINYQRSQLPNYVVPSPEMYRVNPELITMWAPEQVSTILDSLNGSMPIYRELLDRVLVENTDDVIHVLSFEGEFLYLSPSCPKVLEYDAVELVGKGLSTVCHPSDIGPVIRELRACITPEPVSVAYRIRKKHSGYVWFESHGSWHITDRGRQYMVLVGRPRAVYSLDHVAVVGRGGLAENDLWAKLSMSGIVLYVSSKTRPVLGRLPEDLIGKSIQDLMGADTRPQALQALEAARGGQQVSFNHKIRHRKGHMLQVQTTLLPGDAKEGAPPSFLVAQLRFPKMSTPGASDEPGSSSDLGLAPTGVDLSGLVGTNRLPAGNQQLASLEDNTLFTELAPTRGSSWQFELRELEKQNRTLSDEMQRLITRRKKRKRKQSTIVVEKSCSMCRAKTTPEWRRGPSGNRDLCNSCGLRWAKQVRNAAQATAGAVRPGVTS
ncbi:GATA transcription factor LreA [Aspergillus aculeatinus CBS 121060]|uniref:GATA transcription factor LreA n=1 Tax=Aspergillus aculeatinus CBS 121060 TaxID=1448322 RepID=A0ACD1HC15_9EURO|nr:GATA transcription factor LreA [Aspergillus aculeatinus CBS 121060]RAH70995.1 GATA transcription factor LreA [Aspergillus aculeatinus CBS 121060]